MVKFFYSSERSQLKLFFFSHGEFRLQQAGIMGGAKPNATLPCLVGQLGEFRSWVWNDR
jgi:hypothetical protein